MKVFKLSLRNLFVNWWRTLTLGTFIFVGSMILVVMGCFSSTVTGNMEDAIRNAAAGDIQIRPASSAETDMLDIKGNWGKLPAISKEDAGKINELIGNTLDYKEFTGRVRQNAFIANSEGKELSITAGLDKDINAYKDAIELTQGRFLDPAAKNEIIISKLLADKLNIKVGQEVDVSSPESPDASGKPAQLRMKVVGIGDVKLLSGFSVSISYIGIADARYLKGLKEGEFTDFIIYTPNKAVVDNDIKKLDTAMAGTPLEYNLKVSGGNIMGKFIMDGISVNVIMFYSFIVILMFIISILILNLINMIGIERRQQIGTLKAIGFSRGRIVALFLSEIMIAAVFFCLLGIAAGTIIVVILGSTGLHIGPPMDFMMGKFFVLKYFKDQSVSIFLIMMVFSALAALYPSMKAAGVKPVETLKEM